MTNLQWGNELAVGVYNETRKRNSAAVIAAPVALLFAAIAAHLFRN